MVGRDDEDLPPLKVGAVVRVYPTSRKSSPLYFYDPRTNKAIDESSSAAFEVGKVRAVRGVAPAGVYQVTILRRGRELFIDWMARRWVRLSHEPPPDGR